MLHAPIKLKQEFAYSEFLGEVCIDIERLYTKSWWTSDIAQYHGCGGKTMGASNLLELWIICSPMKLCGGVQARQLRGGLMSLITPQSDFACQQIKAGSWQRSCRSQTLSLSRKRIPIKMEECTLYIQPSTLRSTSVNPFLQTAPDGLEEDKETSNIWMKM